MLAKLTVIPASAVLILFVLVCDGRPPRKEAAGRGQPQQPETTHGEGGNGTKEWDLGIEYNRYLQEVVQVLESDPDFRKKLEDADVDKIRDGSIAEELDFVHHGIRNKLDDIKRKELERLRHAAMKQYELGEGIDRDSIKMPGHIEVQHPTFEKEDLMKLIKKTTKDLEEADRMRKDDFKKYEMEKKFEEQERLNHIEDEEKRKEEAKKIEEMHKQHKEHEKPHHPMTKDQLEQVWEEQDHMRSEDWDPKTFFAMHDLNGDNMWDEDEIKMLFKSELDKVYDPNAPEDDMREREEEMERMREHVFKESDKNKDKLISFEEFLTETKRDEFENDPGWDTLDEDEHEGGYTDDEFRAYEMQRQRELQDMINRGIVPQNYPYLADLPPGAQAFPQHPGMQPQHRQMGVPGQPAFQQHPGQPQQQFQGHPQQQQFGQQQQQQFGQQQQQQQQFGQQQQQFGQAQQFAPPPQPGQPQQQFGQPQQQQQFGQQQQQQGQQQFGQPQQFAGQAQQQPPQMGGQPQQQQQFADTLQAPGSQPQAGLPVPRRQPVAGQPVPRQPQAQGQPVPRQPSSQGEPIDMGQPIQGQPGQGQQQQGQVNP